MLCISIRTNCVLAVSRTGTGYRKERRSLAACRFSNEDMMADFTPYQQKIIKRYYDNQDAIQSQRLAELVTDLYLAEGKKRQRVWKAIVAVEKLKVPQCASACAETHNPALVAEIVKEIQST